MTSLTFLIVISVLASLLMVATVRFREAKDFLVSAPLPALAPDQLSVRGASQDARLRAIPMAPDSSAIYKPALWAESTILPTARQAPSLSMLEFGDGKPTV